MMTKDERDYQENIDHSFLGLPLPKQREKMDVLQLAELLLSLPKDSPAYIVLEHEFNLNIAKLKEKSTLDSDLLNAVVTIIAVILAAVLGYSMGTSQI